MDVDLVYFDGCPHVDAARRNLAAALARAGYVAGWREHNLSDASVGSEWRGFPSPTVLIDGVDVSGGSTGGGCACRATGAPAISEIAAHLRSR